MCPRWFYQELDLQATPEFDSENRGLLRAIAKVALSNHGRGAWVDGSRR